MDDDGAVLKHRRSSFPKIHPNSSTSNSNLELISVKSSASYTSLKDLILPSSTSATSILSPPPAASASSAAEISIPIRNRLVKQAAWAYLQPSVSPSASSSLHRFRFSGDVLRPILAGFRKLVVETTTRVYDWLVDALWLILCR